MKRFLAAFGLLTLLALPTSLANAACCCNTCAPACPCNTCAPACCDSCDPCGGACSIQCVTIPKKHFWNLKRTGYYTVCPCMTGGAAPVCPTKIGECVSSSCPSKCVIIPKRHFWEKERTQRMPISSCCSPCCDPCGCDCCK